MKYVVGPFQLLEEQHSLLFDGQDVPLPPKVFSMLLVLVEHEGRTVSQQLLRERVWPDSFVEDAAVSKNISVLRTALRPFAGPSDVIRTLPKRGYQLLLPVERLRDSETAREAPAAESGEATQFAPQSVAVPPEPSGSPMQATTPSVASTDSTFIVADSRSVAGLRVRPRRTSLWLAALLGFTLLAFAGYRWFRPGHIQTQQEQLAVVDFRDLSGTASTSWIGVALQESLLRALSRDGGIPTVAGDQVAVAQEDLGLSHAPSFDSAELSQLSKRLGVQYLLTGTYMLLGKQIRVDFALQQGDRRVREFSQTVERSDLQATVNRAVEQFRAYLKLPQAQTGDQLQYFDEQQLAAQFFAEGLRLSRTGDTPRLARESFSKAVLADPNFAEAHEALATAWSRVGHDADSRKEAQLALDTDGGLPETRRLSLEGAAYQQLARYPQSLEALTRLRQSYPDDPTYKLRLARTLFAMNRYQDAALLLRQIEADTTRPPNLPALQLLATTLAQQGDRSAKFMYADRIMKLARARHSISAEAQAHLFAGMGWMGARDGQKAVDEFNQGAKLSATISDKVGVIAALTDETAARLRFHMPGAIAVGQRAIDMASEIGEDGAVANECINLGAEATVESQLRSAESYFKRALVIAQQAEDKQTQLAARNGLVSAYLLSENLPEAEKAAAQELALARDSRNESNIAPALEHQAQIDGDLGRWASAAAKFQQVADLYRHVGNPPALNDVLVEHAWMLLKQGDPVRAADVLRQVDRRMLEDNEALAGYAEGWLQNIAGEPTQAQSLVARALAKDGVPYRTANGLDVLMKVAMQQKDTAKAHEVAARYLALSRSIPENGGVRRGAARASAQAELVSGNRSAEAVQKLPGLLGEAAHLGSAAEVAELRQLIAHSSR